MRGAAATVRAVLSKAVLVLLAKAMVVVRVEEEGGKTVRGDSVLGIWNASKRVDSNSKSSRSRM